MAQTVNGQRIAISDELTSNGKLAKIVDEAKILYENNTYEEFREFIHNKIHNELDDDDASTLINTTFTKDGKSILDIITHYHCPLLNRRLEDGLCYDIQMIRNKFIRQEALQEQIDYDKANEICPTCPFNQLTN